METLIAASSGGIRTARHSEACRKSLLVTFGVFFLRRAVGGGGGQTSPSRRGLSKADGWIEWKGVTDPIATLLPVAECAETDGARLSCVQVAGGPEEERSRGGTQTVERPTLHSGLLWAPDSSVMDI